MDTMEIEFVKVSFSRIESAKTDYAELFYETLFRDTPSIKPLFKGDIALQRKKLKTTVALVIKGLDRLDSLRDAIFELGARHAGYGVHRDDFPDVVDALIKTFNTVINDFTVEEEDAWRKALNIVSEIMLEGMESHIE
jgi:hemoglobin-like flavoprotein